VLLLCLSAPGAPWASPAPADTTAGELPDLSQLEQLELVAYGEELELRVQGMERRLRAQARADSVRTWEADQLHVLELEQRHVQGYLEGYHAGASWQAKLGFVGGILTAGALVGLGAAIF